MLRNFKPGLWDCTRESPIPEEISVIWLGNFFIWCGWSIVNKVDLKIHTTSLLRAPTSAQSFVTLSNLDTSLPCIRVLNGTSSIYRDIHFRHSTFLEPRKSSLRLRQLPQPRPSDCSLLSNPKLHLLSTSYSFTVSAVLRTTPGPTTKPKPFGRHGSLKSKVWRMRE